MNNLQVSICLVQYELSGVFQVAETSEFVVDDQPLSKLLGIDRDLRTSQCDLDRQTREKLPVETERMVMELCGRTTPLNQFGTCRTVLYRCHCGSDYCGVVSCQIVIAEQSVEWRKITFEDDQGPRESGADCGYPNLAPIDLLTFEKGAYFHALRALSGK